MRLFSTILLSPLLLTLLFLLLTGALPYGIDPKTLPPPATDIPPGGSPGALGTCIDYSTTTTTTSQETWDIHKCPTPQACIPLHTQTLTSISIHGSTMCTVYEDDYCGVIGGLLRLDGDSPNIGMLGNMKWKAHSLACVRYY